MNFRYILYQNLSTLLRLGGGGNVSLLQLWTLFCFGESNDSHETTWGPLLRSSDEEILSTLNHEKDRYQEAIFLGRHRTFQIGTSYVCIELPQKEIWMEARVHYILDTIPFDS